MSRSLQAGRLAHPLTTFGVSRVVVIVLLSLFLAGCTLAVNWNRQERRKVRPLSAPCTVSGVCMNNTPFVLSIFFWQALYGPMATHYRNGGLPPSAALAPALAPAPVGPAPVPIPAPPYPKDEPGQTDYHAIPNVHAPTAGPSHSDYSSAPPPARVPSYYASPPRSPTVAPRPNHDLLEKGWEYTAPPAGSPPPPFVLDRR